jgi:hypothetical protein
MSIKLVAAELLRFLKSPEPEVICVTGKWGVGKTFAWHHYLHEAQQKGEIGLNKYSYVSLFGRNSLEDARTAIVENVVNSRSVGEKPDLTSFRSTINELRPLAAPISRFASLIPGAGGYIGSFNRALFLAVKNQIVCIDDLERSSPGLDMLAILGLVTSLKEEKSCKVILLLNQEELAPADTKAFHAQLEKVADTIMVFEPTSAEAAEIGIDKTTKFHALLSADTQALNIVNIRIIKKIETSCRRALESVSADADQRIILQAVHTISLASYCKFQTSDAPPLEFIKNYNRILDAVRQKDDPADPNENRHKDLLRRYDFGHMDEFDAVLIEGVERGFFDEAAVKQQSELLHARLKAGDQMAAFQEAWGLFHNSFDDNQEAVLDAMVASAKENVAAISPSNFSATVGFLKEFGRSEQAQELIKYYIENRHDAPGFWNLDNDPFGSQVTDPDVLGAFRQKFVKSWVSPDPEAVLKKLGTRGGWNNDDLECLSRLTEDDYIRIFKKYREEEFRNVVFGGLAFRNIANATDIMKLITQLVEGALRRIAKESAINAKRVKNFGVQIDQ